MEEGTAKFECKKVGGQRHDIAKGKQFQIEINDILENIISVNNGGRPWLYIATCGDSSPEHLMLSSTVIV